MKKRILTVVGARPQFIKAAVLSKHLKNHPEIQEDILHTGQHYDANMSEVFFEQMGIPKPTYQLQINGGTHGVMTGQMLTEIEQVLLNNSYHALLVYGDTNSTLAGALAAQKLGIKVIHIEAGLRSFNMKMPEEVNRILTDQIASLLCCPTTLAMDNLKDEGFDQKEIQVVLTGDIMKDAVLEFSKDVPALVQTPYVLATVHRQENTDDPKRLQEILQALDVINKKIPVVCPIHPRTAKRIQDLNIGSKINFIDPVGYPEMQSLIHHSELVITDSGGLQKEAYFHKKYALILRDQTEWVELVEAGYAALCSSDSDKIISGFERIKSLPAIENEEMYGSDVSEKIIQAIKKLLWEL